MSCESFPFYISSFSDDQEFMLVQTLVWEEETGACEGRARAEAAHLLLELTVAGGPNIFTLYASASFMHEIAICLSLSCNPYLVNTQ